MIWAILAILGVPLCVVGSERVAILTDLLAFIREREPPPGESADGVELLTALEERPALELAAPAGRS